MPEYETKDSGVRQEFPSGMRRDTSRDKPRFDLIVPKDMPYEESMLYRRAMLMARGAGKYGERNYELADSPEELDRFRESAFRHFMQWYHGETDEDHAAAVEYNIDSAEMVKWKMEIGLPLAKGQRQNDVHISVTMTDDDGIVKRVQDSVDYLRSRYQDGVSCNHGEMRPVRPSARRQDGENHD